MGRPKKGLQRKSVSLPTSLIEKVQEKAGRLSQDFSAVLAEILQEYFFPEERKERFFHCEHCGHTMEETSFENISDRTAGVVGDGTMICYACAVKLRIETWVRLGAIRTETYPGI